MCGDRLVHHGLRERRLVALVVAVAAVADQIDEEVLPESRAIREGEARRLDARLDFVRVDVDDWDLEAAREAARIERAEQSLVRRREADLIVGDDVDGAAGPYPAAGEKFSVSATTPWPGKGGIAVNEYRQRQRRVELGGARALDERARRARHAEHHGIDRLEVARIGRHRNREVDLGAVLDGAMRAHVILDVAGPGHVLAERCARVRGP